MVKYFSFEHTPCSPWVLPKWRHANDLQESLLGAQKQGLGHKSKIGNVQILEIFGDYNGLISVVLYACYSQENKRISDEINHQTRKLADWAGFLCTF
jgi:hypothetical protein